MARRRLLLASDVGGTFTDLVLLDTASGSVTIEKVPTTPTDPSVAVLAGVDRLLPPSTEEPFEVDRVVHATTLVANTLVERSGAATALLCQGT